MPLAKDTKISKSVSIYATISVDKTLNGKEVLDGTAANQSDFAIKLSKLLENSGYDMAPDKRMATEKLYITINVDGSMSHVASFASGLSLFLLPSYAIDKYTLSATLEGPSGVKHFKISDTVYTWTHLTMLFCAPFASGRSAESETINNIFKTLILEMNTQ